ncbi:MAG: hypothetical protein L6Q99_00830 [Planctomycetes bacterium]|nr:hypothetical protein [Planctomycetota bacterium]
MKTFVRGLCGSVLSAVLLASAASPAQDAGTTAAPQAPARDSKPALEQAPKPKLGPSDELDANAARASRDHALAWIVAKQNRDGSWGTRTIEGFVEDFITVQGVYAWQYASSALCTLALAEAPESPERRAVLEKGVTFLCSAPLPKRGDDWDVDHVWAGVFGTVACTALAKDPRFVGEPWRTQLGARGRELAKVLETMQTPSGGWGYYDDPPFTARPKWATSFTTAAVIPALGFAEELGWIADRDLRKRAIGFVRRCALPNGAYQYSLDMLPWIGGESINDIRGSLGRTQVCNWALFRAGERSVTPDKLVAGLRDFFAHHEYLDVARMRPIPHEAYYFNAAYFYFYGHYHAALVVELLPEAEREAWRRKLRPEIVKTQRPDGSFGDFLASTYMIQASTAFAALALDAGLSDESKR